MIRLDAATLVLCLTFLALEPAIARPPVITCPGTAAYFAPGIAPSGNRPLIVLETVSATPETPESVLVLQDVAKKLMTSGRFRVVLDGSQAEKAEYAIAIAVGTPVLTSVPRYRAAPPSSVGWNGARCAPQVLDGVDYQAEVPVSYQLKDTRNGDLLAQGAVRGKGAGYEFTPLGGAPAAAVVPAAPADGCVNLPSPAARTAIERALEDALSDRKAGLTRQIADLLPVTGQVTNILRRTPPIVAIDVGRVDGIGRNDRFLVFDKDSGEAIAVLRASQVAPRSSEARVHHSPEDHKHRCPRQGDIVVSQGY